MWQVAFEEGFLKYLGPGGSDHCPILLQHQGVLSPKVTRFIFDSRWASKQQCETIVKQCWDLNVVGSMWFCIQRKLKQCRRRLRAWRSSQPFNSAVRVKELQHQLETVYEADDFDFGEYRNIENSLKEACKEEEKYWRDRARADWLRLGDKNTAFFHAKTVQTRAQNRIYGLEDGEGVWKEGDIEVEHIVKEYIFLSDFYFKQTHGF
ncbi:hypothetical protein Vadar_032784 [Vaccinium darrowii]|uniref:Uncharacterized protein n=1 Tax=Vaccinium darrowii TaxID=229202 RepID=A0ACB7YBE1_9ERIC|nr:hypothetical protein Vadar_032784 [Vaccinium darrowii]